MVRVLKFAAFADGETGGVPVGVHIADAHPPEADLQAMAAEAGTAETVFAMPAAGGWRVRYFSPLAELGFRGHATVALGAALAIREGDGVFALTLNDSRISVEGFSHGDHFAAALLSPATRSSTAPGPLAEAVLEVFDLGKVDLHPRLPSRRAHAGADHLVIGLATHEALAAKAYGLSACRLLMQAAGLETLLLAWPETPQRIHTRNPFAGTGLYDDPATSASSAALGGYLRDLRWPHGGRIEVLQGEPGQRSHVVAQIPEERGSGIRVSGTARLLS